MGEKGNLAGAGDLLGVGSAVGTGGELSGLAGGDAGEVRGISGSESGIAKGAGTAIQDHLSRGSGHTDLGGLPVGHDRELGPDR